MPNPDNTLPLTTETCQVRAQVCGLCLLLLNSHRNTSHPGPSLLSHGALHDLSPNCLGELIRIVTDLILILLSDPTTPSQSSKASTQRVERSPRKRGRPRIKEVVLGPKRPRGRPRKLVVTEPDGSVARRRGRPSKVKGSGGVLIEFGKYVSHTDFLYASLTHALHQVIPAVSSTLPQRPLHQGPGAAEQADTARGLPSMSCAMTNLSSTAPIQKIIPDEDPERAADIEDDDGEMGEGLGEEDEDPDDGDERDDEREPGGEDRQPTSSQKTPRVRRSPPPWLLQAFKACTKQLEVRDAQGLPPLYATSRTFWINGSSPYFTLQEANLSPSILYNPRFFIWDPQALFKDLPCPNCRKVLHRHAVISRPRRCIDVVSTFWIIGFRYRCRHCLNPRTQKIGTVTWRSWDPRILAVLPPELAAEFPAKLSHRSAMSLTLFTWLWSCFQNGMSAKQFASTVQVQHLLQYDKLHLQYLNFLVCQAGLQQWSQRRFESFRPFTDTSDNGFHGYTPSAQWFRDMYDNFIEEHRSDFDQHTAMLTANICAIDLSHKVCLSYFCPNDFSFIGFSIRLRSTLPVLAESAYSTGF